MELSTSISVACGSVSLTTLVGRPRHQSVEGGGAFQAFAMTAIALLVSANACVEADSVADGQTRSPPALLEPQMVAKPGGLSRIKQIDQQDGGFVTALPAPTRAEAFNGGDDAESLAIASGQRSFRTLVSAIGRGPYLTRLARMLLTTASASRTKWQRTSRFRPRPARGGKMNQVNRTH